jgi:ankyrin repeat protein
MKLFNSFTCRGGGLLLASLGLALLSTSAPAADDLKGQLQRGLFEEEANQNLPAAMTAYQGVLAQFDKERELAATALFRLGECHRKLEKTNEAVACYQRILREFSDSSALVRLSQQNLVALGAGLATAVTWPDASRPRAGSARQTSLIREELKVAEEQWAAARQRVQAGRTPAAEATKTERQVLRLKRELAAATGSDAEALRKLFAEEIAVVERLVKDVQLLAVAGRASADDEANCRRDLLALKRDLAALDDGVEAGAAPAKGPPSEEEGQLRRIRALLKDSPDLINAKALESGWTPLQAAASRGQLVVLQFLLENHANLEARDGSSQTALLLAAGEGHKRAVELLLEAGADIEAESKSGSTALHLAARNGYKAVVEALLGRRAQVNATDQNGWTALHHAVSQGFTAVADLLLAQGADVNARADSRYGSGTPCGSPPPIFGTPLQIAVVQGQKAALEMLLGKKANPNLRNKEDHAPLHYAAAEGKTALVEALLRAGAEVNPQVKGGPNTGWTPLHYAVRNSHKEMLKLLLTNMANPDLAVATECNPISAAGDTGLAMATRAGDTTAVELLLTGGANPNLMNEEGSTPLKLAAWLGKKEIVALLLAHHADTERRGQSNSPTPLLTAVGKRDLEVAELLLQSKANPNTQGEEGKTALHILVENLRQRPANPPGIPGLPPSFPARVGSIPMRSTSEPARPAALSAEEQTLALARLLLTNRADVNLRNAKGLTPLNLMGVPAAPRNPTELAVAELLRQHGARDVVLELEPATNVIRVWRQGQASGRVVFTRDSRGLNRFTLMDALFDFYSSRTEPWATAGPGVPATRLPSTWRPRQGDSSFDFPDLANLRIKRLGDAGTASLITVNLASLDAEKDLDLEFGDIVEIPEREHALSDEAQGMNDGQRAQLATCLARKVEVVVKSVAYPVDLPPGSGRYLAAFLDSTGARKVLISSSDFSRLLIQRRHPRSGAVEATFTNDVAAFRKSGKEAWEDLVLCAGDRIGVPDKEK